MAEKIKKQIKKYYKMAIALSLVFSITAIYATTSTTKGAQVTSRKDTLSDSRPSVVANHTIEFATPNGADAAGETIILTFASYVLTGVDDTDIDLEVDSACDGTYETSKTLAASAGASPQWGAVASGQAITFTAPTDAGASEIPDNACVKIEIGTNATGGVANAQITNPAVGVYNVTISGTFESNTSSVVKTAILTGVTVSATVAETLTFSHAGTATCAGDSGTIDATRDTSGDSNTVPFGTLAGNYTVGCQDLTVSTNTSSGYSVTAQETDQLTYSGSTIPDSDCDAGCAFSAAAAAWTTAVGFGHGCEKVSGDGVVCDADYGVWSSNKYYREFASLADSEAAQVLMSYSGAPTANGVARVHYKIKISGTQAAGAYENTIVYVATPTF